MTGKKKAEIPRPAFNQKQRVVYDGWDQLNEVHNIPAIIEYIEGHLEDGDGRLYSRRSPKKLAWWYHVRLVGDRYTRTVCEDELSLPPTPKFEPGNLVDFDVQNQGGVPKSKGSGIVVDVHQDADTYAYSYDIWVKSGDSVASSTRDLKTPYRIPEGCLSTAKKAKKEKDA